MGRGDRDLRACLKTDAPNSSQPALRCSDVGISVDSGTNVAKEAADIILLEKDLLVLDHGVIKGRETYGNTVK